jgi:hypothetical protein
MRMARVGGYWINLDAIIYAMELSDSENSIRLVFGGPSLPNSTNHYLTFKGAEAEDVRLLLSGSLSA